MIRATKYIYINILTFVMLVFAWFNGQLYGLLTAYGVMTLHETAHLIMALVIGLKVSRFTFHPFGVNLKLKNRIIRSVADEILLYIAGPLVNAVLALGAVFTYRFLPLYIIKYFYICNISLFIMNMLPILPLDGGIILRKILSVYLGYKTALAIMRIISAILTAAMAAAGGYILYISGGNYSLLLLSALLFGNIFTQKEKYNVDLVRELMFYKKKNKKNIRLLAMDENEDERGIIKSFRDGKYHIVYVLSGNGRIKRVITEDEIIEKCIG